MKKVIPILITVMLTGNIAYALDTTDWYQYNGYSTTHSFSLNFPKEWQSKTYGDDTQGFAPAKAYGDSYFLVQEFEGETLPRVIQFYINEGTRLVETRDFFFSASENLAAKEAIFLDLESGKQYPRTLIKRGGLIIVLSGRLLEDVENFPVPEKYRETVEAIHDSFKFTDDWHEYIDLKQSFSFIFPAGLEIEALSNGVTVVDPDSKETVFSIIEYPGVKVEDLPDEAEGSNENLEKVEDTFFHGIENALIATYHDEEEDKSFDKIFVENKGTSYAISGANIETNYPRSDYYNRYVAEMLESFEFFDIETEQTAKGVFSDVPTNHQNWMAINTLANIGIIAGYADGTFKPNKEINRAELTKMVVAAKLEPEEGKYNNCFPDVKDEWFAPYVCYAKEQGWIDGYKDGTFKPTQEIKRVEAIKVITEVLFGGVEEEGLKGETPLDVFTDKWYGKYFIFADNRDLLDKQHIKVEEDGYYYYPSQNISRKEVAQSIYRSVVNFSLPFL